MTFWSIYTMDKLLKGRGLWILGAIFVMVGLALVLVLLGIGRAYQGGLKMFIRNGPEPTITSQKKKNIRKITLQRTGSDQCYEVTPDGVVRVFETCNGELTEAARLSDPKYILALFKRATEGTLPVFKEGDVVYQLTIETDEGTETIQIVLDDDSDTIIDTIENIIEGIADPSPTAIPSGSSLFSPYPSPSANPGSSVSPSPSADPQSSGVADQPFNCTFVENGQNKPYRISNIVCSDEPQP